MRQKSSSRNDGPTSHRFFASTSDFITNAHGLDDDPGTIVLSKNRADLLANIYVPSIGLSILFAGRNMSLQLRLNLLGLDLRPALQALVRWSETRRKAARNDG